MQVWYVVVPNLDSEIESWLEVSHLHEWVEETSAWVRDGLMQAWEHMGTRSGDCIPSWEQARESLVGVHVDSFVVPLEV